MAGYWAENRVLGGVVLFDRKAEMMQSSTAGLDVVYIHPDREEVTYRICLLTDAQKKALLDFLLIVPGTGPMGPTKGTDACPLPIIPDGTNVQRVDPEEPIRYTGIYRDQWERKMPPPEWLGDGRAHAYIIRWTSRPKQTKMMRERVLGARVTGVRTMMMMMSETPRRNCYFETLDILTQA